MRVNHSLLNKIDDFINSSSKEEHSIDVELKEKLNELSKQLLVRSSQEKPDEIQGADTLRDKLVQLKEKLIKRESCRECDELIQLIDSTIKGLPSSPLALVDDLVVPLLTHIGGELIPQEKSASRLGKMRLVNKRMDDFVDKAIFKLLDEGHSLRILGNKCQTAEQALEFLIKHKLKTANLQHFPDLTDAHLKRLAEASPALEYLSLNSDKINVIPQFKNLKTLDLSRWSNLRPGVLKGVANLQSLRTLKIDCYRNFADESLAVGPGLTDRGLIHLSNLTRLEVLNLSSCSMLTGCYKLTGQGLIHLSRAKELKKLVLWMCKGLTDEGLKSLAGFKELQTLGLTGCEVLTGEFLGSLRDLKRLQVLDLKNCKNLKGQALVHLVHHKGLVSLDLSGCSELTDQDLVHLQGFEDLRILDFSQCTKLTDKGLANLSKLTDLEQLNFNYCTNLTNEGLTYLENFKNLRVISFWWCNKLTREKIAEFQNALPWVRIML